MKSPKNRDKQSNAKLILKNQNNTANNNDPNFSSEIQLNINFTGQLNMSVKAG